MPPRGQCDPPRPPPEDTRSSDMATNTKPDGAGGGWRTLDWLRVNEGLSTETVKLWGLRGVVRSRYQADGRNRQIKHYSLDDVRRVKAMPLAERLDVFRAVGAAPSRAVEDWGEPRTEAEAPEMERE